MASSAGLGAAVHAAPVAYDNLRQVLNGDGDPRSALTGIAGAAIARPVKALRTVALGRSHLNPDRSMSVTAPARIASNSKHVTAIGLMKLVETNRIGLEDDASAHLGFVLRHPAFSSTSITLRMLLSHTSGISNGPSYPVPFDRPLSAAFSSDGAQYDDGMVEPQS